MKVLYNFVRVLNIGLLSVAIVAFIFFGWLFTCNLMKLPTPQLGPLRIYVVLSDSMSPTFVTNDAVFIRDVPHESLSIGDIICFEPSDSNQDVTVTHRIVQTSQLGFKTRGDANNTDDSFFVYFDNVLGKVVGRLPYFGLYMGTIKEAPYLVIFPVVTVIIAQLCFGLLESWLKAKLPEQSQKKKRGTKHRSKARYVSEKQDDFSKNDTQKQEAGELD